MEVLHFVPGSGVGGIERFVMDITSVKKKEINYSFVVFARKDTDFIRCIKKRGSVYVFPGWTYTTIKEYFKLLKNKQYDVVHAHLGCWSFIVLGIAKQTGVKKRIAHSHSADTFSNMNYVGKTIFCLSKIFNSFCITDYMACSDHACKYTFGSNVMNTDKYTRILNPVDFNRIRFNEYFIEKELRNILGLRNSSKIVCNIGYLGKHKNQSFLLHIAERKELSNVDFLLVGDGWNRTRLEKMINDKNLTNVHLVGVRNEISDILKMSDIFVLPSILEGLGTVVLEAQACGTPCIISENVTIETDMGLGLVQQIPLLEEDAWVLAINTTEKKVFDYRTIIDAFSSRNVTIDKCISLIESIYKGTKI